MIGKIIRRQRLRKGWTIAVLADKMGVRPNTIERWEKERSTPRIDTIIQLEQVFFIEPGSLLSALDIDDNAVKKVFIIVDPNYETNIDEICRDIIKKCPNHVIFSPHNAFSFYPEAWDRNWVFQSCRSFLIYLADEVWTFGDWQSCNECQLNVHFAALCGLHVVHDPPFLKGGGMYDG